MFSKGWHGCSEGFPEDKTKGKFRGAALPAQGKSRPSRLFYSDLNYIKIEFFNFQKKLQYAELKLFESLIKVIFDLKYQI